MKAEAELAKARAALEEPAPAALGAHPDAPVGVARTIVRNKLTRRGFDEKKRRGDEGSDMQRQISGLPSCPSDTGVGGLWIDERLSPRELLAKSREFEALADEIETEAHA